jgi:hypothetical protein
MNSIGKIIVTNLSKKKIGAILISIGIFIPLILSFFTRGYNHKAGLFLNILDRMHFVIIEGKYFPKYDYTGYSLIDLGHYEGRWTLPYKYALILGIITIFIGTILIILSKSDNNKID